MKPATAIARASANAEQLLRRLIAKFEPNHQALIRAVRKALRRRFPTAYELAYDNYNFFELGYGPTQRPSVSGPVLWTSGWLNLPGAWSVSACRADLLRSRC